MGELILWVMVVMTTDDDVVGDDDARFGGNLPPPPLLVFPPFPKGGWLLGCLVALGSVTSVMGGWNGMNGGGDHARFHVSPLPPSHLLPPPPFPQPSHPQSARRQVTNAKMIEPPTLLSSCPSPPSPPPPHLVPTTHFLFIESHYSLLILHVLSFHIPGFGSLFAYLFNRLVNSR